MSSSDFTSQLNGLCFKAQCDTECVNETHVIIGSSTLYLADQETIYPVRIQLVSFNKTYHKCITTFASIQSELISPDFQIQHIQDQPRMLSFQLKAFYDSIINDRPPHVIPLFLLLLQFGDIYMSSGFLLGESEQLLTGDITQITHRPLTQSEILCVMKQGQYHKRDIFPDTADSATMDNEIEDVFELGIPPCSKINMTSFLIPTFAILSILKQDYERVINDLTKLSKHNQFTLFSYPIPTGQSFQETRAYQNPEILWINLFVKTINAQALQQIVKYVSRITNIQESGVVSLSHTRQEMKNNDVPYQQQQHHTTTSTKQNNTTVAVGNRKRKADTPIVIPCDSNLQKCNTCNIFKPICVPYFGFFSHGGPKKNCIICRHMSAMFFKPSIRVYPTLIAFLNTNLTDLFVNNPNIELCTIVADILNFGMVQYDTEHREKCFESLETKNWFSLPKFEDDTPFEHSLSSLVKKLAQYCMYQVKPHSYVHSKTLIQFVKFHIRDEAMDETIRELLVDFETQQYCVTYNLYNKNQHNKTARQNLQAIYGQIRKWMKSHHLETEFLHAVSLS